MGASAKAVDFSGVKDRGAFSPKRVAEGDYAAVITKVEDAESKENKDFMYVFTIKLDKFSQNSYPYRCKITENQLWKLRNIAVAAGLNVPKKRMKFDPNKVVGKRVGVTMEDDEYEGKPKSDVAAIFPLSELADGVEEADDNFDEDSDESAPVVAGDEEFDPEDEAGSKTKKDKKKGKAAKEEEPAKKKKDKKKKGSDENLEELDISDV